MQRRIYALGLGPGDSEYISVKGVNVLKSCDLVVVPQSDKTGRSVAKEIVKQYVSDEKIFMYFFPMNNDKELLDRRYSELAEKIEQFLNEGKKVCYVTIGDLSIYSTFNYLYEKLKEKEIKVEKIAGIPSFIAAANRIDENIVIKGESFCVVEMERDGRMLEKVVSLFDTVIVMKVHKRLKFLIEFVRENKMVEKAYLVERCTLDGERVFDLLTDEVPENAGYLSTAILYRRKG
ncbi:precorrin-2 C(20)-methyltransferase [Deferribacter autotrophicus]|uniref:Precorrin-2 C(20)-methyltransferase n=1 Tax=Deferribacter autotrophicus TaxID=500465 RepID=A0A5A8F596_9BACT|nr:precorrin-2 C(20)-methyltransferase [Deferribacter autotrophicus]KAA0257832.1 precorrin-2 C(20)-methyltransferase [Deferribacter autotrophicus]